MPEFHVGDARQLAFNGFGNATIPDPRDDTMDAYLADVISGGSPAVASSAASASEAGRRVLRAHGERLASRAVRGLDRQLLVPALVALVLGGLDRNEPAAMMPMALIDDAAERLGVDHSELFESAARIIGHPGTVNLMVWLARAPEDRTPEAMGFEPSRDPGGFRYRWAR